MSSKYTRDEMFQQLKQYFQEKYGFSEKSLEKYPKHLGPVRLPLYGVKKEDDKILDEIVVDVTTSNSIIQNQFFPTIEEDEIPILDASPVVFYQYYFPKAKIYLAYPDYMKKDKEFDGVKNICKKRGIGLLEISEDHVKEKVVANTLVAEFHNDIKIKKSRKKPIREIIEDYLENYVIYLVYYPDPVYRRREIIRRSEEDKQIISLILIDKLPELKNINYKKELIELGLKYRQETHDDYEIADICVKQLWKEYLGLEYPDIHRRIENILQRQVEYREHFIHQFQVFLIGASILDKIYPEIAARFEKTYGCKIETAWLAASTFHDFSYGLQNFDTWLMQFFEDILRVRNKQTKENLNLLNLDAAMIRESLFTKITKIINQLGNNCRIKNKEKTIRFFYEKAVRDRNHGVLSAISLLKLFEEVNEQNRKINEKGILEAAVAIGCHDEDIWEALCGCQGHRRSSQIIPSNEDECIKKCGREQLLWSSKRNKIFKEKILNNIKVRKCESWERETMKERIIDKIKFESYPLLFLLTFCDSVQDEGRVTTSDNHTDREPSSLTNVFVNRGGRGTSVNVKLRCDKTDKKEEEIERIAWCFKDTRFRVSINDRTKIIDGSGG